jgi:hypothetical protein
MVGKNKDPETDDALRRVERLICEAEGRIEVDNSEAEGEPFDPMAGLEESSEAADSTSAGACKFRILR